MLRWTRAALQAAYILSEDLGTNVAERLFVSPRKHRRPARERAVLATGQSFIVPVHLRSPRWAETPSTHVHAWRWGIGPTILLIHGWEGRGSQLGAFVEPLVAAGLSVVAFDAPGHGDSPGNRTYLTDLADTIADVVHAIGPVHGAIAHSFGAAGLLLARMQHGVDLARNVMIAPNVVIEDSVERFARHLGLDDADRLAFEHQLALHSGLQVAQLALSKLVGQRESGLLAIHDREDREVGFAQSEQLIAAWPNARLAPVTGLGHRRILRDPAVIAETLAFVGQGIATPVSDLVREVDRSLARA